MNYKYKRSQIFGKKLEVPKLVLNEIYNKNLSFKDFIKYNLEDKIPTSCITEIDKQIIDRFGLEKAKEIDWELIDNINISLNVRDIIMSIEPQTEDINSILYELIKDKIKPSDYTLGMKTVYSDRLFDLPEGELEVDYRMKRFNNGEVSLKDIINNWNLYKNKDLSYCLLKDRENTTNITDNTLKEFMSNYGSLAPLMIENTNIYEFINKITTLTSEEEIKEQIKNVTDKILSNPIKTNDKYGNTKEITNEEYKEIFKYSSLEDYLKSFNSVSTEKLIKELKELPKGYIFNTHIPFSTFLNDEVLSFVGTYGLKNVIDFDNECGQPFSKDDCVMLKSMYSLYMKYSSSDPDKTIYTKKDASDRPYTKDEFYEAVKKMAINGPSNWNYSSSFHKNITGEFRRINEDLFISEQAPKELQDLFYTKKITPSLLAEHPEYIQFLKGKDLSSCFEQKQVRVEGSTSVYGYENLYTFINKKLDFDSSINFIVDYRDVFDTFFHKGTNYSQNEIFFSIGDNINDIQKKIGDHFKKLIIEKKIIYPKNIPQNLIASYPSLFLSNDAPKELQEVFYDRTIDLNSALSNPNYRKYLEKVDLEVFYKYMPVSTEDSKTNTINLVNIIKKTFSVEDSFDVMLLYGKYIETAYKETQFNEFKYNINFSKDGLLDEIDSNILQAIINGKMKYDEKMPTHFKNNNPTLFLDKNVPQDIKNKFYNRTFTLEDFDSNLELLEVFGNTNVACGFPTDMSWIIPLFNGTDDTKISNLKRLKVISEYSKIKNIDFELKEAFKEYIIEFGNNIDIEKIEYVAKLLSRIYLSNSSEIFAFRKILTNQLLKTSEPIESLNKIEKLFIKNNIPTVGKVYSSFEIMHPNFDGFDFDSEKSMISPVLKKTSTTGKKMVIFSDLIKASFGSNNRSVNAYLQNIEIGSNLYDKIRTGQLDFNSLGEQELNELTTFSKHLATMYNNTMNGKREQEEFTSTGNVLNDILELSKKLSPDGSLDYNLANRVVRMFCGFAGINTLEQAKEYINKKIKTADVRNRNAAKSDMVLEQGDFIKGIGDIEYLRNILQNGSVSKEYLGSSAGSDATPLDTDVSMIINAEGTINEKMDATIAKNYGPIWFVLKNDDRFMITRTNNETLESKIDMSKMEAFYTGAISKDHYGIRTGFASSEINYIVMEEYDPKVGLEIAMNGFYIPVADKKGKIIFTPKDYDDLRKKMSGLSYFGEQNFAFSKNLVTEDTEYLARQIEQSNLEVEAKRNKINNIIRKSVEELGLHLKTKIDGDLTNGFVELIDTGSTGRGTNKPGDGDFDFMMRLDRSIISDPTKKDELKTVILKNLRKIEQHDSNELTNTGDFRLKNVQLDNETNVDIDISFVPKTDKISYSTDMSLQDRLATIKKNNPEKYKYVVANILLAKQVLKQAEAYKPNRGEVPQGGLGGVGIENWILQNGGSFIDAAQSFVEAAEGKTFKEFSSTYQIWDFGDNHLAARKGTYPHDNFVANNMSESGYKKMVQALQEYLKTREIDQTHTGGIRR